MNTLIAVLLFINYVFKTKTIHQLRMCRANFLTILRSHQQEQTLTVLPFSYFSFLFFCTCFRRAIKAKKIEAFLAWLRRDAYQGVHPNGADWTCHPWQPAHITSIRAVLHPALSLSFSPSQPPPCFGCHLDDLAAGLSLAALRLDCIAIARICPC